MIQTIIGSIKKVSICGLDCMESTIEPLHAKTNNLGFKPGPTQTVTLTGER